MLGGVLSCTVMVWLQEAVLPHSSVATQVRLVAYLILPPVAQLPAMGVSVCVSVTVPHRSVGTGSTNSGVAGHSIGLLAEQIIVGGVLSCTVMVWLQEAVLPHSSVATQVRLVAYLILPPV